MADPLRVMFSVLTGLSVAVAVGGNLFLLLLLILNEELSSDTPGLALSAALSDLALALSSAPFAAHNSLWVWEGLDSDGALCQGGGFLLVALQWASLHAVAWLTIHRFAEICFALKYRRLWTARRSRVALVLLWFCCVVGAALPLLGYGRYAYSHGRFLCCPSFTPPHRGFVVLWAASVATPIVLMCSLYGYIVYVGRKQALRGTFMCNETHCFYVPANAYLRSSIVMVTDSVCLLLCWTPYVSVGLYEAFTGLQTPLWSSALSTWLVLSSSALNPWINILTQKRLRAAAQRLIGRFHPRPPGISVDPRPQRPTHCQDSANHISTRTSAGPLTFSTTTTL
ncbi:adrenocorticotropic hormone receptor [Gouania willdenowi]|uniref:adrenocorticotropic hormone receptor n=1 Tax=Gouania willdenowi TaxID=441366 RepID=UPI001055E450|nr:adrenocorticotropic hormone receptor-like [Gouania willdenowi]XP_028294128.1 adrenocorticotropic hormone receptor-like [Gouania willdenowi]